jgi:hypothetical protein
VRGSAIDTANGTAAVGFVASYLAGFNWPTIAAFLAAVYSLILIGEKVWRFIRKLREARAG